MIETHPLGSFVPAGAKYLLLGSFVTKEAFDKKKKHAYVWFYANGGRNQFWPMLAEIYKTRLRTKTEMQKLCRALGMAVADIIYQCERKNGNNLDTNLVNMVYALEEIAAILENNPIAKIFFTSRFVEKLFKREFKNIWSRYPKIQFVTLPSPSPRYAATSKSEKLAQYKKLLPKL